MRLGDLRASILWVSAISVVGCSGGTPTEDVAASKKNVSRIEAGPDAAKQAQTALINAKAGEVVEFGEGRFPFKTTLSLDVSHVTIRGQGPDKTILVFKDQGPGTGGEGLLVTSKEDVTLQDFAVEDARGDAIKANGTKRILFRNVRAEWTGGAKETNGGYGLYPVLCKDVLIEGCTAIGASDAGIYVGQSEGIIVRRNTARQNVAGIEIENSTRADVYENLATDNAGGILIFSLPDLPTKDGRQCRVFKNKILANNHANFAPKGNIVATVQPGTGLMIMANDQVEVFGNTIEENQNISVSVLSYLITERPIKDEKYDPFCETIHIHDNQFAANGKKPGGAIGDLLGKVVGTPVPDMLYDGIANPKKLVDGKLPEPLALKIHDNGDARIASLDPAALASASAASSAAGSVPKIEQGLEPYKGTHPPLAPVSIEGIQ